MRPKLRIVLFFVGFLLITSAAFNQISDRKYQIPLAPHPRILLFGGEEAAIKKNIGSDSVWSKTHQFILDESNKLLGKPPVERVLIGRRLLDKSREALRRIFFLSYSWRMTSDKKYFERAEKELLAVSSFTDWNPSHFLDVAEMTMAVSIGYDWLYQILTDSSRIIIKNAIIEKGLNPSLDSKNNGWLKATHNWNQVCNAGMTFGALAVFEDQKDLSERIIDRSITSIKLPMDDYLPDGAYPEGYSYWGYGTSFNIMFLSAMEKLYGDDYGLSVNKGFFKTAEFMENMTGPSGRAFNYSDSGSGGEMHPAMFWFGTRLNDPTLLWQDKYYLLNKKLPNDRLLPAVMIWSAGMNMNRISVPSKLVWVGQGKNPVAFIRTSWSDSDAIYVAIKGGSPSVNHGHMDVGSFIMEAKGERWAIDFGPQDYNSLETAGVDLWNMKQNSQRWDVFRYNNRVHNTLTVNDQLQTVGGYAPVIAWSDKALEMNAITDIASVYNGLLKNSLRGIAVVDNQFVTIRDEVETQSEETVIRWNLLTQASVAIKDKNTAVLTKNGKTLTIKVNEPLAITMRTWSTVPSHSYDAHNPGSIMVGFEVRIPANTKAALTVLLLPDGAIGNSSFISKKLEEWPKN